jgi:hypothetical protein
MALREKAANKASAKMRREKTGKASAKNRQKTPARRLVVTPTQPMVRPI